MHRSPRALGAEGEDRGARAWLRENGRRIDRVRFDVVVCEVDGDAWTLRHIEAAFDASP